jgi:nucleotide-binding universal stress UspA family protein
MQRILVATDFSTRSDRALRRASLVARKVGAELTLAHVVDVDLPESVLRANKSVASAVLADSASMLQDELSIRTDWLITIDDVHTGIIAAADAISADLIVIGPHRSRFRDVFVGTTAERVVRQSMRPLLIAVDTPSAHHRNTLLALDFDDSSKVAARAALDMGIFDHTAVVVMHAFDAVGEGMMRRSMQSGETIQDYVDGEAIVAAERLRSLVQELDLPPSSQTVASMKGTPARTILESAREVGSDLIVLGASQKKGFERALVGSVTADVIRDAHRDILIIPVNDAD